jgi:hypothetical protein
MSRIYTLGLLLSSLFMLVNTSVAQDIEMSRIIDRTVIKDGWIFSSQEREGLPFYEVYSSDTNNPKKTQLYKTLTPSNKKGLPPQPFNLKVQNNSLYGVTVSGDGISSLYFSLFQTNLSAFKILPNGTFEDLGRPSSEWASGKKDLNRNIFSLDPLNNELFHQYVSLTRTDSTELNVFGAGYDYTINSDGSITLYIVGRTDLSIWQLLNIPNAEWKKIRELPSKFTGYFNLVEGNGTKLLMSGNGNVYDISGNTMVKVNPQSKKLIELDDKNGDDSIFIENQDTGEHWIVSTKKSADGTIAVSNSRSIKAGKIEDSALPANLTNALNSRLKVKSDKAKNNPQK